MKKVVYSNYRVEVEPTVPWPPSKEEKIHKSMIQALDDLEKEIRRHCDFFNISGLYDTDEVCSFCGSPWDDEILCCDEGIEEADTKEGK